MKRNLPGFTFMELLIASAVIGILAFIGTVGYLNARAQSRDAVRLLDIKQMALALEHYYDDNNFSYPDCNTCDNQGTWDTCLGDALLPYVSKLPKDPQGAAPYCYERLITAKPDGIFPAKLSFALERSTSNYDNAKPAASPPADDLNHFELEIY